MASAMNARVRSLPMAPPYFGNNPQKCSRLFLNKPQTLFASSCSKFCDLIFGHRDPFFCPFGRVLLYTMAVKLTSGRGFGILLGTIYATYKS